MTFINATVTPVTQNTSTALYTVPSWKTLIVSAGWCWSCICYFWPINWANRDQFPYSVNPTVGWIYWVKWAVFQSWETIYVWNSTPSVNAVASISWELI